MAKITTIIPTMCELIRKKNILHAIESIHLASSFPVRIILVVNGQRFDPTFLDELKKRDDIEIIQFAEGSLVKAHLVGRSAVTSEYFSFLDDDDEYLEGALDIRFRIMEQDKSLDLVVTNGYICQGSNDILLYSRLLNVPREPIVELFQENWLHNCNHLFRSSSISVKYFEDPHAFMEWTWLGFKFAQAKMKIGISDTPTFRYNDTPASLSKSSKFPLSRIALYHRMLKMNPGKKIVRTIRERLSSAWHDVSMIELIDGNRGKAFESHLRSMTCHWRGLRFLSFSRYFLLPSIRQVEHRSDRNQ